MDQTESDTELEKWFTVKQMTITLKMVGHDMGSLTYVVFAMSLFSLELKHKLITLLFKVIWLWNHVV